jgi:serine protease Do
MMHLSRPCLNSYRLPATAALLAAGICLVLTPSAARAQAHGMVPLAEGMNAALAGSSSAGYLGVDIADIDSGKAQTLKLKEARGALITLIDHDAPAGKIGLKVNDVVLAINGQNVESAEQLRRMLRETPPGRKISMVISREGNTQTLAVELADRKVVEHDVWGKIGSGSNQPSPAMGLFGGGKTSAPSSFHMPIFARSLNIGALVEPLTSQMAEQLGVEGGVMVKQVTGKSDAATAGLKALDVIVKVGADAIKTSADWDRSLRANAGKSVPVTILRDKKQQTLTLQIDPKHRSAADAKDRLPGGGPRMMAELDPAPRHREFV